MSITSSNNNSFPSLSPTQKQKGAASCRACGTHITFKKLETGKSVAIQDDSSIHRCSQWRRSWRVEDG